MDVHEQCSTPNFDPGAQLGVTGLRVGMAVSVGGIAYVIVLFLFSLVGTIVCLAPALPLLFAAPVLYAKWCNLIEYLYFTFCACMIRLLLGTRMEVHGDASAIHHDLVNSLVISNHRYAHMWVASATCWNRCNRRCKLMIFYATHSTRMDWMFLWLYFGGCKGWLLGSLRIVLKWGLKKVPGFGWGCQMFGFLFLRRVWAKDQVCTLAAPACATHHLVLSVAHLARCVFAIQEHIGHYIATLEQQRSPYALLLFPEGTDLSDENKQRGHVFAESRGLQLYNYVLHPRVAGFCSLVEGLRPSMRQLVDLTMAYDGPIPSTEKAFVSGGMPTTIHVLVRVYDTASLPKERSGLDAWCRARFAEKEALLQQFYASRQRGESLEKTPWGTGKSHSPSWAEMALATLFWAVIAVWCVHTAWSWPRVCLTYIAVAITTHVAGTMSGGWDVLETRRAVARAST